MTDTQKPNTETKPVYEPPQVLPLGDLTTGQGVGCAPGTSNVAGACVAGGVASGFTCTSGGAGGAG